MGHGLKVGHQGSETAEVPTRQGVEECVVCGGRKGVPVHASHEDGGTSQAVLPLQRPLSGDHTLSEWSRDSAGGKPWTEPIRVPWTELIRVALNWLQRCPPEIEGNPLPEKEATPTDAPEQKTTPTDAPEQETTPADAPQQEATSRDTAEQEQPSTTWSSRLRSRKK